MRLLEDMCSYQLKITLKASTEKGYSAKFMLSPSLSETSFPFARLFPYQKTEISVSENMFSSVQPVHVIGLT